MDMVLKEAAMIQGSASIVNRGGCAYDFAYLAVHSNGMQGELGSGEAGTLAVAVSKSISIAVASVEGGTDRVW